MIRGPHVAPLLLAGCALQNDFPKVSKGQFECLALPEPVGRYDDPACFECLQRQCCTEVSACAADASCAEGLDVPLTPVASLPESELLDQTIACLQRSCDAECGISFGCEFSGYAASAGDSAALFLRNFGRSPTLVQSVELALCGTAMEYCFVEPSAAVAAQPTGLATLTLSDGQPGNSFAIEDASYVAADADPVANPDHYPPHNVRWSEPLPRLGSPMPEFLFSTASVGFLVSQADGKEKYDPAGSHIVFYMHNCLPVARYLGNTAPAGGVADTQLVLRHLGEELDANRVVYRIGDNYERGASSPLGSGGVANVESGLWNASAEVTLSDGSQHRIESAFQVPNGGVGVVHIFPASTMPTSGSR